MLWSYNPSIAVTTLVWAIPRSLATTSGITFVFFSSGYLDVSVPRVRLVNLCIQLTIPSKLGGFPHSEIPGSKSVYRLPEAYRRLPRPSSPVAAKAFTVCAYSLDHITPSSLWFDFFLNCFDALLAHSVMYFCTLLPSLGARLTFEKNLFTDPL